MITYAEQHLNNFIIQSISIKITNNLFINSIKIKIDTVI